MNFCRKSLECNFEDIHCKWGHVNIVCVIEQSSGRNVRAENSCQVWAMATNIDKYGMYIINHNNVHFCWDFINKIQDLSFSISV